MNLHNIKRTVPIPSSSKRHIRDSRLAYFWPDHEGGGDPDAVDAIVPMVFGNLALDPLLKGVHGRLMVLKNDRYDAIPLGCGDRLEDSGQCGAVLSR